MHIKTNLISSELISDAKREEGKKEMCEGMSYIKEKNN
jgi:hypothetical protein